MRTRSRALIALAFLTATCSVASANPGTAIVFHTAAYLVFGNALIALVEFLIARKFGTARPKAIGLFFAANYLSAWVGVLALAVMDPGAALMSLTPDPVQAAIVGAIFTLAVMAVLTIAIEWPFFWCVIPPELRTFKRVAKVFIMAHVVSYTGLAIYYLPTANLSLLTDYRVVNSPAEVITAENPPWVYYITLDNSEVRRIRANGEDDEFVHTGRDNERWRIAAIETKLDHFELGVIDDDTYQSDRSRSLRDSPIWPPRYEVISSNIGEAASIFGDLESVPLMDRNAPSGLSRYRGLELNWRLFYADGADLRPSAERTTTYKWFAQPYYGITLVTANGRKEIDLLSGITRRACTHSSVSALPGDNLVWEMSFSGDISSAMSSNDPRAIYVMSNKLNRIARLVYGRSPIVAYETAPEGWRNPLDQFRKLDP